jgi:acetyl-CoA acetyltransferase
MTDPTHNNLSLGSPPSRAAGRKDAVAIWRLNRRHKRNALNGETIGGGQGIALLIENPDCKRKN